MAQTAMFSNVTGTTLSLAFAVHGSVPKHVVNVTVPVPLHGSRRPVGIALGVLYVVKPTTWMASLLNSAQIRFADDPVYPPPDVTRTTLTVWFPAGGPVRSPPAGPGQM